MKRRNFLKTSVFALSALSLRVDAAPRDPEQKLAELEKRHGGRLGVSILDTGTGRHWGHRAEERFLMCSTFKLLLVAAVLARVDAGSEQLDRRIIFGAGVLLDYAPVARQHMGPPGMSIAALCEAAITVSDNTAANLLLHSIGGPAGLTDYLRRLGDPVTRLDRFEPQLNVASPGDARDTTTPTAMSRTMEKLLLGTALAPDSRLRLIRWLRDCTTGTGKLRKGLPAWWQAGDKTGSGSEGETNDVAIIWPPHRRPLLVTAYMAGSTGSPSQRNAILAAVGSLAATL